MLECSGDNHRHHQLTLIVGQGGIHVATNLRATHLLAQRLVQDRRHVHVQRLVGQVHQAGGGHSSAVNYSFQVVSLGHAVSHVKVSGELDQVRKSLGSTGET